MRIAVIGAKGQLGTDLCRRLEGEVIGLDLPELDVRQADSVRSALAEVQPEVVVNCAAMTNVDSCEDQADLAFEVNAQGAYHVARAAEQLGAAVVFVSTDYVFGADGERDGPYTEDDLPGPVNVYGGSKLAGEHLSRAYNSRCYIVRTCGLYGVAGAGGKGGNFVETILRLAQQNQPIRVVSDQRVSPCSTWELAGKVSVLITTRAYGLYHIAARDSCTWCEFAEAILEYQGLTVRPEPITSKSFGAKARRPFMSALSSTKLARAGLEPCRPWRDMLSEYCQTRTRGKVGAAGSLCD